MMSNLIDKLFIRILLTATLFISVAVLFPLEVRADSVSEFPDPYNYVNDFAGILTNATESELNSKLKALEDSDSTQIFVITVNSLPDDVYLDNFIPTLTDYNSDWAAGQEQQDNGAILTIVVNDRDMRIDVGYGLEGVMPDLLTKHILDEEIKPYFQNEDYDSGVKAGVIAMTDVVEGEYSVDVNSIKASEDIEEFMSGALVCFTMFIFIVVPILTLILGSTKSWWLGGILGVLLGLALGRFLFRFEFLGQFRYLSFIILPIFFGPLGLLFDFIVSRKHRIIRDILQSSGRHYGGTRSGRGGFLSSGGGGSSFGGGGGGSFGGGGSSSSW